MSPPTKLDRKPISTAFGAKVKTMGTSRAGGGVGDQLLRDALESGDDLGEDHADAGQDDEHSGGELAGLHDGPQHVPLAAAELALDVTGPGHQGDEQVDDAHGAGDDDGGVAQEAEPLGDLQILGGLLGVAEELSDEAAGGYAIRGRSWRSGAQGGGPRSTSRQTRVHWS